MTNPPIYFFSDFGVQGPYLGQMETAVLQIASSARVINLIADAPAANPRASAYLLAALLAYLPDDAILVCVVDPGVGSERGALMLRSGNRTLVGPDNGLLAVCASMNSQASVYKIAHDSSKLSASFHGRDLFAPIAAKLWGGEDLPLESMKLTSMHGSDWPLLLQEVIYLDHYGNAMTGLPAEELDEGTDIIVGTHVLRHARTFSAADRGCAFWYSNSCGLIELAVNQGRADDQLDLAVGSQFTIIR